jgi:hypothetical protein
LNIKIIFKLGNNLDHVLKSPRLFAIYHIVNSLSRIVDQLFGQVPHFLRGVIPSQSIRELLFIVSFSQHLILLIRGVSTQSYLDVPDLLLNATR